MAHATARAPYSAQPPRPVAKGVMKSVIVYGPPACGKTRNAQALLNGFGLDRLEDDWEGQHYQSIGVLYLTNHVPARFSSYRRVFSFKEALAYVRRKA